jgi:hypothetical protein
MTNWHEFPWGFKLIIVLGYLSAGLYVLMGLGLLISAEQYKLALYEQFPLPYRAALGEAYFLSTGILLLFISLLTFFVTRSLGRGENWARIVGIIYASLAILGGLVQVNGEKAGGAVLAIVIYAFMLYFLAFNSKVRNIFRAG